MLLHEQGSSKEKLINTSHAKRSRYEMIITQITQKYLFTLLRTETESVVNFSENLFFSAPLLLTVTPCVKWMCVLQNLLRPRNKVDDRISNEKSVVSARIPVRTRRVADK